MGTKKTACLLGVVAALVLVIAVAGASADGVRGGDTHHGVARSSDVVHGFNPIASYHEDFTLDSHKPGNGIRSGYLLRESLLAGKFCKTGGDNSKGKDPTSTPEPGSLVLLLAGVGGLFFARRSKVPVS